MNAQQSLFQFDLPKDNSPLEDEEISSYVLYLTADQWDELKKMAKKVMEMTLDNPKEGNLSQTLYDVIKEKYEDLQTEKTDQRSGSGETAVRVSGQKPLRLASRPRRRRI